MGEKGGIEIWIAILYILRKLTSHASVCNYVNKLSHLLFSASQTKFQQFNLKSKEHQIAKIITKVFSNVAIAIVYLSSLVACVFKDKKTSFDTVDNYSTTSKVWVV